MLTVLKFFQTITNNFKLKGLETSVKNIDLFRFENILNQEIRDKANIFKKSNIFRKE